MLITKIIAKNFKTYRELDLDLTVNEEQPIILIGGENGGGKTTLFRAIYSALYGLKVKDLICQMTKDLILNWKY
jgi:DNA sulfur modification protein DndD